ncbi:MAG: penicillin-binding protein 2 [bacterium]
MKRKQRYSGGGVPSVEAILRLRRVTIGISLVVSILVFRLWSLQFLEGEQYRERSVANYEQRVEILSQRGSILDRNMNPLVEDIRNYNLFFNTAHHPTSDELSRTLVTLSEITGKSEKYLRNRLTGRQPDHRGRRLILEGISFPTMVAIGERALVLPGIVMEPVPGRNHRYGDLAAHVLGRDGEIDAARLEQSRERGYGLGDRIGMSGVEYTYEESLRGRDGWQIIQTDSLGRQRDVLRVERPPQAGKDIVLSLDLGLQKKAEEILGASKGVIIALDPRTGAVLTMASSPRYDPNTFQKEYVHLIQDRSHPLTNRAIAGLYAPGSVFKIFEAFGLVEEGIVNEHTRVSCPGQFSLGGDAVWRCWKKYGHGPVGLVEALRISCDVFFYQTAGRGLKKAKIATWARNFHLGMLTGIDLPYEKAEPFPPRNMKRSWYPGDTINASIGQGFVLVTPIEIAAAAAAVANGGTLYAPHVAAGVIDSSSKYAPIRPIPPQITGTVKASPKTWKLVTEGLWEVVNAPNGTGRRCYIEGFPMMGKTGTAEVGGRDPHAWFVCFGPVRDDNTPEIVVVVLLEHGGHGGESASPLAKEFLEFYLNGGREIIA